MKNVRFNKAVQTSQGFTLIEVLVSISLLSIAMLGLCYNAISSFTYFKRNERNIIAEQLAYDKMEALAAIRPLSLTAAYGGTEYLIRSNIHFVRTTSVVVNADRTRTATVQVTNENASLGGTASVTNTFVSWVRE